MVAAASSVVIWAGLLLALLCVVSLVEYADRATESASGRSGWRDLGLGFALVAYAFVIGLIATAALYSLPFTGVGSDVS
jgi:hypothetical protein